MPLYIPHEYIVFGFSQRLGGLICHRDIWWDFAEEAACEKSMDNVKAAIEWFAVPWFRELENERYVVMQLQKQRLSSKISVYDQEWLSVIGERGTRSAVIQENIEKLKLPRRLMG